MIMANLFSVFQDNLIGILLGIILSFNVTAYKVLWNKLDDEIEEREKLSETMNMVLNRIFGIEKDPTDEGHLVETEEKFADINDKLDEIVAGQKQSKRERKKEHKKVTNSINSIIVKLSEEEKLDFEKDKLE